MPAISPAFERAHNGTPQSGRASYAGATPSHHPAGQAVPRRGDPNNSPGPDPHHHLLSPARAAQPTCSSGRAATQPSDGPTIKLGHPSHKGYSQLPGKACQILPNPDGQGTERTQSPRGKTNPRRPGAKRTQPPRVPNNPIPPHSTGVGPGFIPHESRLTNHTKPNRGGTKTNPIRPGPKQSQSAEAKTNPIHPGPKRTATGTNHESRITNHSWLLGC